MTLSIAFQAITPKKLHGRQVGRAVLVTEQQTGYTFERVPELYISISDYLYAMGRMDLYIHLSSMAKQSAAIRHLEHFHFSRDGVVQLMHSELVSMAFLVRFAGRIDDLKHTVEWFRENEADLFGPEVEGICKEGV